MSWVDALMHVQNTLTYLLIYLIIQSLSHITTAGVCWENIDDREGTCRRPYIGNMTHEDCCSIEGRATVSWSNHSGNSDVFFQVFLAGATGCHRCHKSCETVKCYPDRACRMIDGLPQCVCRPRCSKAQKALGPVCGSDGRKYKNECALKRTNCKEQRSITVEYYGRCRRSCKHVQCRQDQHCLEDQNRYPHCWACDTTCKHHIPDEPKNYFCAVNGRTYKNKCELTADICRVGHSITIAYNEKCNENATCLTTTCPRHYTCLKNPTNGQPVCTDCTFVYAHCAASFQVKLCGTDGRTYPSYCAMKKLSCKRGIFVTAKRAGRCKRNKKSTLRRRKKKANSKNKKMTKGKKKNKMLWKKRKQRERKMRRKGHKNKMFKNSGKHHFIEETEEHLMQHYSVAESPVRSYLQHVYAAFSDNTANLKSADRPSTYGTKPPIINHVKPVDLTSNHHGLVSPSVQYPLSSELLGHFRRARNSPRYQSELLGHFRKRNKTSESFSDHLSRTTEIAYGYCVLVDKATKITTRSQLL